MGFQYEEMDSDFEAWAHMRSEGKIDQHNDNKERVFA